MGCSENLMKNWKFVFHSTYPPAANHSLTLFSRYHLMNGFGNFPLSVAWDWTIIEYLPVDEFQFDRMLKFDFVDRQVVLVLGKSLDFFLYCCRVPWELIWTLEFFQYLFLLQPIVLYPNVVPPMRRFLANGQVLVSARLQELPNKEVLCREVFQACVKPVRFVINPGWIGPWDLEQVFK
jgi:hypothetical protein